MSDPEMQRLIDEAQAALDDHFRPRLVVDNKAQLNMTDLVARLRRYYPSNPEKENDLYRAIREAAAEIERLRIRYDGAMVEQARQDAEIERLRDEKAYLMRAVNMDSDAVTEIERLRAALRQVVSNIEDYERINNLAPRSPPTRGQDPGRKHCWDSVAHAHDVLGDAPDDLGRV